MISKDTSYLSRTSIKILREGLVELKVFTDGVNYIDTILRSEKHLKDKFKNEVLENWISGLKKSTSKVFQSVIKEIAKQNFQSGTEESDKMEEFLLKKRAEVERNDLSEREQRKLKYKMIERFLDSLYPIPKLADTIEYEKTKKKRENFKSKVINKNKTKILIPKVDQIDINATTGKEIENIDKIIDEDPELFKKFKKNLIIKCFNERINFHSISKIKII